MGSVEKGVNSWAAPTDFAIAGIDNRLTSQYSLLEEVTQCSWLGKASALGVGQLS